ncbi:MAG: hypothetical protein KAH30_07270 [Caldisericia bacterium]|nr:hypothetical protein [Caldisericia bacterium]
MNKQSKSSLVFFLCLVLVFPVIFFSGCEKEESIVQLYNPENWSVFDPDNTSYDNSADISGRKGSYYTPTVKVDSLGFPHLVWCERSGGRVTHKILYVSWDGENWICADGSQHDPNNYNINNPANISKSSRGSIEPIFVLDDNDYPHILWTDFSFNRQGGLLYVRWNGEDWVCIDNSIYDPSNKTENNPAFLTVETEYMNSHSLKLDSQGYPHFIFFYSYGIYYLKWDGENLLCADSSIYNSSNKKISNPGNFIVSKKIDNLPFVFDNEPSFILDKDERPHISWEHDYCIYYIKWDGENWVCFDNSLFDSENENLSHPANITKHKISSREPKIILDNNNYPSITWKGYFADNSEICFIRWNGENWICIDDTVFDPTDVESTNPVNVSDNSGDSGRGSGHSYDNHCFSVTIDKNNLPHFAWADQSFGDKSIMVYVKWDGNNLKCVNNSTYNPTDTNSTNPVIVSGTKDETLFTSLALDANGFPHITWINTTDDYKEGVYYVRWDGKNWVSPTKEIPLKNEKFKYRKR